MNRIEKNKTQTDQAWNKLHNRLETDGLLPTVTEHRFAYTLYVPDFVSPPCPVQFSWKKTPRNSSFRSNV